MSIVCINSDMSKALYICSHIEPIARVATSSYNYIFVIAMTWLYLFKIYLKRYTKRWRRSLLYEEVCRIEFKLVKCYDRVAVLKEPAAA